MHSTHVRGSISVTLSIQHTLNRRRVHGAVGTDSQIASSIVDRRGRASPCRREAAIQTSVHTQRRPFRKDSVAGRTSPDAHFERTAWLGEHLHQTAECHDGTAHCWHAGMLVAVGGPHSAGSRARTPAMAIELDALVRRHISREHARTPLASQRPSPTQTWQRAPGHTGRRWDDPVLRRRGCECPLPGRFMLEATP